jgi:hypothetical protein
LLCMKQQQQQQQVAVQQHTNTQHQCGELKRCNLFSSFHVQQNLKIGCKLCWHLSWHCWKCACLGKSFGLLPSPPLKHHHREVCELPPYLLWI